MGLRCAVLSGRNTRTIQTKENCFWRQIVCKVGLFHRTFPFFACSCVGGVRITNGGVFVWCQLWKGIHWFGWFWKLFKLVETEKRRAEQRESQECDASTWHTWYIHVQVVRLYSATCVCVFVEIVSPPSVLVVGVQLCYMYSTMWYMCTGTRTILY